MTQPRIENLLSIVCRWVLVLIPILFVVAHAAACGAAWNFATGAMFNPLYHVISSYAWRSPAGWTIVACMLGFAYVLGFVSWHAAKRGPGFLAWFTAVVAAMAMFEMLEIAWYPFKPSRESFTQIQQEIKKEPTARMMDESWSLGLYATGVTVPGRMNSPAYLKSLRSHWLHQQAIGSVQPLIFLTMLGGLFLWNGPTPRPNRWTRDNKSVQVWVLLAAIGCLLMPDYTGLAQRLMYLGIYVWMHIVVREIERVRGVAKETECEAAKSVEQRPFGLDTLTP